MKKIIFIMIAIVSGLATIPMYSMFVYARPVTKKPIFFHWDNFNAFTRKYPYRLSTSGVETSSAWRRVAVRAALRDTSDIKLIAVHIANFVEREARNLFYNQNITTYKEPHEKAFKNAFRDAQNLAHHEKLMILIDYDPTFEYETSSEYSESL